MIRLQEMIEKRQVMRYSVVDGVVVAVRPYTELFGYMIDVSLGGLSFRYIDSTQAEPSSSELTILVSAPRLCLDHLPYRTVADFALPAEFSFSSIPIRRRCVEFGRLNLQQRLAIEELIMAVSVQYTRMSGIQPPAHKCHTPSVHV